MDDELAKGMWDYVDAMNRRGGSVYGRPKYAKDIVERSTAEDFAEGLRARCGIDIRHIESREPNEPDIRAQMGDRFVAIELTELTDGPHNSAIAKFLRPDRASWTRDKVMSELKRLITEKRVKRRRAGIAADALLIHTDEPHLTSEMIDGALEEHGEKPCEWIRSAHLLVSSGVKVGGAWPVFRIFGDLGLNQ